MLPSAVLFAARGLLSNLSDVVATVPDMEQTESATLELLRWGSAAAVEFGYPAPPESWVARACERVGPEVLGTVSVGVSLGLVVVNGGRFSLPELGPKKGPYAWFSRNPASQLPAPNWEYFVQVATWLSVRESVPVGLGVGFEDGLMDVSVRHETGVIWCLEVKEKPAQLGPMLSALQRHAEGVAMDAPDRHDDPLRKAKYIVGHRPRFFSLVAAGRWDDFHVEYPDDVAFQLVPVTRQYVHDALSTLAE